MKILNEIIKPILALLIIFLAFSYFFSVLIIERKADPQAIIGIVSMATAAIGYYFGSSSGSAKKDMTIDNMTANNSSNSNQNDNQSSS